METLQRNSCWGKNGKRKTILGKIILMVFVKGTGEHVKTNERWNGNVLIQLNDFLITNC